MLRRYIAVAFLMILALAPSVAQTPAQPRIPPDSEIRKMLANRIDIGKQSVGIVVGVISVDGLSGSIRENRQAQGLVRDITLPPLL